MYMNSLPYGYPPIKGTDGELKRNKAYLMQMPPQDTDSDSWSKLTDLERKRLTKISEKNKTRACGIGNLRVANKKERKVVETMLLLLQFVYDTAIDYKKIIIK